MRKYKFQKEDVIYEDEDYMIIKKYVGASGSLTSGLDLIAIGTNGLRENRELDHLANESDKLEITYRIVEKIWTAVKGQIK
jgi:23S rRNA-/tRNA-specific pseudouridylate synthase